MNNLSKRRSCCIVEKQDILNNVNNNDSSEIFTVPEFNIIEEYSYKNSEFSLYSDNFNDTLSVLCTKISSIDSSNIIDIYTMDGVYTSGVDNNSLNYISYMKDEYFKKRLDLINKFSKPINSFQRGYLFLYITNHNLPIMLNGNLISNDDLYKNFKTLYNKYTLISDYIPANSILTKLLNMVTTYIATGQINKKGKFITRLH